MAEGGTGVGGASAKRLLQQKSASAVIINVHLSHCRPGEGAGLAATMATLLYQSTGVTGPLVMIPLVLVPAFRPCPVLGRPYQCRAK
jgi:hypothetical protein